MKLICSHCQHTFSVTKEYVDYAGDNIKCPRCKKPVALQKTQPDATLKKTIEEKCENCGRIIGNLETRYLFKNRVVCLECCTRLKKAETEPIATSNPNYVGQQSRQALNPRTSGMAIASFVLGLVGMCLGPTAILGLVFGLVALHQIKKSEGLLGGRGLALAGTILSTIDIMIVIFFLFSLLGVPVMRGRIDAAKWSEGRAMMNTIATATRAYCATCDDDILDLTYLNDHMDALGFVPGDLEGTYFTQSLFTIQSGSYDFQNNRLNFVIQANKGLGINKPDSYTLDQAGTWTPGGI